MSEPNGQRTTAVAAAPATSGRPSRKAIGGVVAAFVAVALLAQVSAPSGSDAAPAPELTPVVATELVCPPITAGGENRETRVTAITPVLAESSASGRADIGTTTDADAYGVISGESRANGRGVQTSIPATVGRAVDGRAPGFAMGMWTTSGARADHGFSGLACTEPTNDAWFVGTASGVGQNSRVYLTNTEASPAVVDVAVYGTSGQINAPAGRSIVVPPRAQRAVRVEELAPGAGYLAVRVTASSGRVGAALRDTSVNGLLPRGSEWVPASAAPTTRVVVPGLGSGPGTRRITIFAPGEGVATVNVSLVGRDGTFAPTGGGDIEVDRGRVTTIDPGAAMAEDDTAVLVTADVPLIAGVRVSTTGAPKPDLAFAAGTPALQGTAVVTGIILDRGFSAALMLTAPDTASSVSVQRLVNGAPVDEPYVIDVPAGTTVRTNLREPVSGESQLIVRSVDGTGPVHPALFRTKEAFDSNGVVIVPLRAARISVEVPDARPESDVGLGR
jgi:hypothetical protein